jgi:hypothetical protein
MNAKNLLKAGLILAATIIFAACNSDKWSNGDFVGKATLTRINASSREEKVEFDKASFSLTNAGAGDMYIKFEDNSLIPGCELKALRSGDYYTGDLRINFEIPTKICRGNFERNREDIPWGIGEVKEENGEVILTVKDYNSEDQFPHYKYEFRGRRKGWF